MTELVQALWDQMRTDLRTDALLQLNQACHSLLSGDRGALTELQVEDLQSIERAVSKLTRLIEGEPIDWTDYTEVAHALRGPLNTTLGFSRLMLKGTEGPINESQREALETTHTISRRLLALFNLLLDGLQLMGEDLSVTIEPVQVGAILQGLIALGRTLAVDREFTIETDVKPEVAERTVMSDAKRLKQALAALLAVLVRYMDNGKITMQAKLSGGKLQIGLENRTCQLPAPLLANLSSLLTEEADHSLPYDAHLRMGLARHLLTKMDGHLEARQTGDACCFIVTLPAG